MEGSISSLARLSTRATLGANIFGAKCANAYSRLTLSSTIYDILTSIGQRLKSITRAWYFNLIYDGCCLEDVVRWASGLESLAIELGQSTTMSWIGHISVTVIFDEIAHIYVYKNYMMLCVLGMNSPSLTSTNSCCYIDITDTPSLVPYFVYYFLK